MTFLQRVVHGCPPPPQPYCTIEGDAGLFYVMIEAEGSGFRGVVLHACERLQDWGFEIMQCLVQRRKSGCYGRSCCWRRRRMWPTRWISGWRCRLGLICDVFAGNCFFMLVILSILLLNFIYSLLVHGVLCRLRGFFILSSCCFTNRD